MEEKTIYDELLAAARTDPAFTPDKPANGESEEHFVERLCVAIGNIAEDVWNTLSEDKAQVWYNEAVSAKNSLNPIPALPGFAGYTPRGKRITPPKKDVNGRGVITTIRKIVIQNPELSMVQVRDELIKLGRAAENINENTLWMAYTDCKAILTLARELGWSAPNG